MMAKPIIALEFHYPMIQFLIKIDTIEHSHQCDPAYTANMFMDLLSEEPNSLMAFGAACSDVTEILAEMSAYRKLAQVC